MTPRIDTPLSILGTNFVPGRPPMVQLVIDTDSGVGVMCLQKILMANGLFGIREFAH